MKPCLFLTVALLSTVAAPVRADALDSLRERLAMLEPPGPATAKVDVKSISESDDDGEKQSSLSFQARDDASGFSLILPRATIAQALAEANGGNPERVQTTAQAVRGIDPVRIAGYFDGAASLAALLDGASLKSASAEQRNGKALTRLDVELDAKLAEREKKYVKKVESTGQIWLDSTGLPVEAERQMDVNGRAMMVISFKQTATDRWTFIADGSALRVASHETKSSGEGGGQKGKRRATTRLTYVASP